MTKTIRDKWSPNSSAASFKVLYNELSKMQ